MSLSRSDLTEEVLRSEYAENLLSIDKISKKYHTEDINISKLMKQFGIQLIYNKQFLKRGSQIPTQEQVQVLFGSLCGDASISICYGKYVPFTCTFVVGHCLKQLDYLVWKRDVLLDWLPTNKSYHIVRCTLPEYPSSEYFSANIGTVTAPLFNELRDLFYPNGKKVISTKVLDSMNELALAVWFMDDGNRDYASLVVSGIWSVSELADITDWFDTKWNIKIDRVSREEYDNGVSLVFNKKQAAKLNDIIQPFMQPCMMYKLTYFAK